MKRQSLQSIILTLTTAFAAQAYMAQKGDIVASVPFDFSIGGRDLRAGEYVLRYDERAHVLEICEDGVYCTVMPAVSALGECDAVEPRLVFGERDGRVELREVLSTAGEPQQISVSRLETDERLREVDARTICIHEDAGLGIARNWH